jgi:hypothetical protein
MEAPFICTIILDFGSSYLPGERFGSLYATSLLSCLDAHLQFKPGTRDSSLLAAQVQQLLDVGDVGQAVLMQQMLLLSSAEKHDSTNTICLKLT